MDSLYNRAKEILRPAASSGIPELDAARMGRVRHIFLAQYKTELALHVSPSVRNEVDLLMQAEAARQAGQQAVAEAVQQTFDLGEPESFDPEYVPALSQSEPNSDMATIARQTVETLQLPLPNLGDADEKLIA